MRRSTACLAAALCLFSVPPLSAGTPLRVTAVKIYTPPAAAVKKGDVVLGGVLALAGVEVRDGTAALPQGGGVRFLTRALAEDIVSSFASCCSAATGLPSFKVAQVVPRGRRAEVTILFGGELSALYVFGPHERMTGAGYASEKLFYALPPGGLSVTDRRLSAAVLAEVERVGAAALKAAGLPVCGN